MTTIRPQQRYDHRLREFVQRTGDLTIATDLMPASAMTSLDTFRAFESSVWFPAVADTTRFEAYVRDLVVVQENGSVRPKMGEATAQAIAAHLLGDPRDYTKVHSPTLAIFGETFFDARNGDSAQRARHLAWDQKYWAPFRAASMERVRRELPKAEIVSVPGTHIDFLLHLPSASGSGDARISQ